MKVEITKEQLIAICEMADTISTLLGGKGEEFYKEASKQIVLIDRFLKKNGYQRSFK